MADNTKTTRNFQCRDALWNCFEQMARELECSVDYLVNDAMKQYARQRGYAPSPSMVPQAAQPSRAAAPQAPTKAPPVRGRAPAAAAAAAAAPAPSQPQPPPPAAPPPAPAPPPPPAAPSRVAPPPAASAAPTRRGAFPPPPAPPPPPGSRAPGASRAPIRPSGPPPPPPPGRPAARPAAAPASRGGLVEHPPPSPNSPRLFILYEGQRFPVTKERFIIGRGRQTSDLTIKDPNVSRQHAMIEFHKGQYYMVDMGSTNGVEYGGQRVQRRIVNESDVFYVCDHELKFSFAQ